MANGVSFTTSRTPPLNGFAGLSAVSPTLLRVAKGGFEVALARHIQKTLDKDAPWWVSIGLAFLFADGVFTAGSGVIDAIGAAAYTNTSSGAPVDPNAAP